MGDRSKERDRGESGKENAAAELNRNQELKDQKRKFVELADHLDNIIAGCKSHDCIKESLDSNSVQLYNYQIQRNVECQGSIKYFFKIDDIPNTRNLIKEINKRNNNTSIINKLLRYYKEETKDKMPPEDDILKLFIHSAKKFLLGVEFIEEDSSANVIIKILNKFIKDETNIVGLLDNEELKMRTETSKVKNKCRYMKFRLESREEKNAGKCYHFKRLLLEDTLSNLKRFELPNSWEDFKYLTESKDRWNQYTATKNVKFLDEAYELCDKIHVEEDRGVLFKLCYNLANVYFEKTDFRKAAIMFSKASGMNPNANAYIGEGFAYRYQNNFFKAIVSFERALWLDNNSASSWDMLGNIYLALGAYASDLYDKSIACLNQAIKMDADSAYPWLYIGINYSRKAALEFQEDKRNDYIKIALTCLEKAQELAVVNGYKRWPLTITSRAACMLQKGDEDISIANDMINNSLKEQDDHHNRACALYLLNKKDEAEKLLKEAFRENRCYTKAQILFDPDIYEVKPLEKSNRVSEGCFLSKETCNRFYEVKKFLSDFTESPEIIDGIREILKIENEFIRASFEAVSGNKERALEYIKEIFNDCKNEIEKDPHFEEIYNLAVVASLDRGSNTDTRIIIIKIYKTTEKTLGHIDVSAKLYGARFKMLNACRIKKTIEKPKEELWSCNKVEFDVIIDKYATKIKIEVDAKAQNGIGNCEYRIFNTH
jgi:tetratricopeptide (TPR) repeat protein